MTEMQRLRNRIGLVHTGDVESPDVDLRVSFGESSVVLGRGVDNARVAREQRRYT